MALSFVYYNFVRIHKSLKVSLAMAAGLTDKLWSWEEVIALIEAKQEGTRRSADHTKKGPPSPLPFVLTMHIQS